MDATNCPGRIEDAPTARIAHQTNAELVFGADLTDFASIKDARLREILEYRGHSVHEAADGLWYSCCSTTCHEDRAGAEEGCVGDLANELADEVRE